MQDGRRWRPYEDGLARDRSVPTVPAAGRDAHAWWDTADRPAPPPQLVLAGFGQRLAAFAIDVVIVGVLATGGVAAVWIGVVLQDRPPILTGAMAAATFGVVTCLPLVYETVGVGLYGCTPGKAALGLRVVGPDGTVPIGVGRGLVRTLARMVSGMVLYIGYLMALWDDERRTLHDIMADTRVVRVRASALHVEPQRPGAVAVQITALLGATVLCMLGVSALVPDDGVDLAAVADGPLLQPPPLPGEIEPDPGVVGAGPQVSVYDLSVADCFVTGGTFGVMDIVPVPCSASHDAQLYAIEDLRGAPVLSDGGLSDPALASLGEQVCRQRADVVVETQRALDILYLHPTVETWRQGDREARCVITPVDGTLSRSLVASGV